MCILCTLYWILRACRLSSYACSVGVRTLFNRIRVQWLGYIYRISFTTIIYIPECNEKLNETIKSHYLHGIITYNYKIIIHLLNFHELNFACTCTCLCLYNRFSYTCVLREVKAVEFFVHVAIYTYSQQIMSYLQSWVIVQFIDQDIQQLLLLKLNFKRKLFIIM